MPRPPSQRWLAELDAALRDLERTDPEVAAAAEQLDTMAWKASIGWPKRRCDRGRGERARDAPSAGP